MPTPKAPLDMRKLQEVDPLKRLVEKQSEQTEFSPMDPPEAFAPPAGGALPYEALPPFLQHLTAEHQQIQDELTALEEALQQLRNSGGHPSREVDQAIQRFFRFLDEAIVPHHLREEKLLFPRLQQQLLESGLHSRSAVRRTAVDMLEDDHIKLMQLAAVVFNFLGLTDRLPDPASRALVMDAAIEQGRQLVEMLRLHIFREENVLFPLAVEQLSEEEFLRLRESIANSRGNG